MKITRCPNCESRKIKRVRGSLELKTKKKSISVPDIDYFLCSKCLATYTDIEAEKRIDAFLARKRKRAA